MVVRVAFAAALFLGACTAAVRPPSAELLAPARADAFTCVLEQLQTFGYTPTFASSEGAYIRAERARSTEARHVHVAEISALLREGQLRVVPLGWMEITQFERAAVSPGEETRQHAQEILRRCRTP